MYQDILSPDALNILPSSPRIDVEDFHVRKVHRLKSRPIQVWLLLGALQPLLVLFTMQVGVEGRHQFRKQAGMQGRWCTTIETIESNLERRGLKLSKALTGLLFPEDL